MLEKPNILIVDDTPDNLALMSDILKEEYKVRIANNGEKALKIARGPKQPDLILLDIMMPDMDGYEVCRRLKGDPETADIPVIFLTAKAMEADEKLGLDLGAVDYITKPISIPILLSRVRNHLRLKAAADYLKDNNTFLQAEIAKQTELIRAIQDVTILALASLAETRDAATGNHIRRTQRYIEVLTNHLKNHPRFQQSLTAEYCELVIKSAPLHDIGKVGIPDSILLKPGRLLAEEFAIMKNHSQIGKEAIDSAERSLGTKVEFLQCAKEIALYHHEKWDGSGYPIGLSGDAIPISARLMAVADVYDALISPRVYKDGMPHEEALAIIREGRGSHFDPDIVGAFLEREEEIRQIALQLADHES